MFAHYSQHSLVYLSKFLLAFDLLLRRQVLPRFLLWHQFVSDLRVVLLAHSDVEHLLNLVDSDWDWLLHFLDLAVLDQHYRQGLYYRRQALELLPLLDCLVVVQLVAVGFLKCDQIFRFYFLNVYNLVS